MRKYPVAAVIVIAVLSIGRVEADQWDDALQSVNTFGPPLGPATNVAIQGYGVECSNTSPLPTYSFGVHGFSFYPSTCVSSALIAIDLNQFARQRDLLSLQAQVTGMNASLAALQTQVDNISVELGQVNQTLHDTAVRADQGIAMSLAMAGVGDIQSDEHFAISANWGTFHGQNGAAFGAAYRLADHVSVNGGLVASLNGGPLGGRAGIRVGW